jgi:hypothetical protein
MSKDFALLDHGATPCRMNSPVVRVSRCQSAGWSLLPHNAMCPRSWLLMVSRNADKGKVLYSRRQFFVMLKQSVVSLSHLKLCPQYGDPAMNCSSKLKSGWCLLTDKFLKPNGRHPDCFNRRRQAFGEMCFSCFRVRRMGMTD